MPSPKPITISQLVEAKGDDFHFEVAAGQAGLESEILLPELNRPSLALAGFTDFFSWNRIQIMGVTEMRYLECLTDDVAEARLRNMYRFKMPCVIVTTGLALPQYLLNVAEEAKVPLIRTKLNTTRLYGVLSPYLDLHFAPVTKIHGGLVDVFGMGVLINGDSGTGKSECALELVERGHRLVADDIVTIKRPLGGGLVGLANDVLKHFIEVRGLGIMDIEVLFGIGAVKPKMSIDVSVKLERWDPDKKFDRLGLETEFREILGIRVPEYRLAVQPGRNIAILTEVAALNQRYRNTHDDSPGSGFFAHHQQMMASKRIDADAENEAAAIAPGSRDSVPQPEIPQTGSSSEREYVDGIPSGPIELTGGMADLLNLPTQDGGDFAREAQKEAQNKVRNRKEEGIESDRAPFHGQEGLSSQEFSQDVAADDAADAESSAY